VFRRPVSLGSLYLSLNEEDEPLRSSRRILEWGCLEPSALWSKHDLDQPREDPSLSDSTPDGTGCREGTGQMTRSLMSDGPPPLCGLATLRTYRRAPGYQQGDGRSSPGKPARLSCARRVFITWTGPRGSGGRFPPGLLVTLGLPSEKGSGGS
jgi:hypothetical protein